MEKVVLYENQTLELKGQLDNIESMVETDYGGATTYKDIQILVRPKNSYFMLRQISLQRLLGSHLDGDGSQLFLLERELPHTSNCRFVLVIELQSGYAQSLLGLISSLIYCN